ncbi:uncharacterized protein LOC122059041 [Macadamia integrifolia]|uniref:uncharacterized protein LOC122059041 n=1 Tax=Macadamia integrifolia TaxID=60698 RepID=UPI001C52C34C|nr:uncharacterized protein LOC122059041 [Macadamia integrifolia]
MESNDHILLDCPFARATWFSSSLSFIVPTYGTPKVFEWLMSWDQRIAQDKKKVVEMLSLSSFICWFLWISRDDMVFNRRTWSPIEVSQIDQCAFQEFWDPNFLSSNQNSHPSRRDNGNLKWFPPRNNIIKVNCDAAWLVDSSGGGLGFIGRDGLGTLLFSVSEVVDVVDVFTAEALAIRVGLVQTNSLLKIQIESNYKEVISHIS